MDSKQESAFPSPYYASNSSGLTKREYFAGCALTGLAKGWFKGSDSVATLSKDAVKMADQLLYRLNQADSENTTPTDLGSIISPKTKEAKDQPKPSEKIAKILFEYFDWSNKSTDSALDSLMQAIGDFCEKDKTMTKGPNLNRIERLVAQYNASRYTHAVDMIKVGDRVQLIEDTTTRSGIKLTKWGGEAQTFIVLDILPCAECGIKIRGLDRGVQTNGMPAIGMGAWSHVSDEVWVRKSCLRKV